MEQTSYEQAIEHFFPYVSAIGDQVEIFKSYPVRVRSQEKIAYYEVGASNIGEDGAVIVDQNTSLRNSANATGFEKLSLRPGDIILPYRSKKLQPGLYIESSYPLIPNPSLIIIRSGSIELGKYLVACLQQPFIKSHIEASLITLQGKHSILDLELFKALLVPPATGKAVNSVLDIEKYSHYSKRAFQLHKQLTKLSTLLLAEAIAKEYQSLDSIFFEHMDVHLDKLESIVSSIEASSIHSPAIDLLRTPL